MLLPAPPLYPRKRKPRPRGNRPPAPAAALTLVAADYDPGTAVILTFDRAIDISSLDGSAIIIDDGAFQGFRYSATLAAALTAPATVRIELDGVEEFVGPDVRMTAGAGNGIVAVDDGGTWAGVVNVVLPLP